MEEEDMLRIRLAPCLPYVTCALCAHPFTRPYTMKDCLHTFCADCLRCYWEEGRGGTCPAEGCSADWVGNTWDAGCIHDPLKEAVARLLFNAWSNGNARSAQPPGRTAPPPAAQAHGGRGEEKAERRGRGRAADAAAGGGGGVGSETAPARGRSGGTTGGGTTGGGRMHSEAGEQAEGAGHAAAAVAPAARAPAEGGA